MEGSSVDPLSPADRETLARAIEAAEKHIHSITPEKSFKWEEWAIATIVGSSIIGGVYRALLIAGVLD